VPPIGIVSDLHGNLPAVEAVWRELEDVDRIYCLGDIVGIGPHPGKVVSKLMDDERVVKVMGNHDLNTINGTDLGPTNNVPRQPHHGWVRDQLDDRQLAFLNGPFDTTLAYAGRSMRFMHRHPVDCWSKVPYLDLPFPEVLDEFYRDVEGGILFFGHTHFPLDVTGASGRRYLNPGAVGVQNKGRASFLIVNDGEDGPAVERREAAYDVPSVIRDIRRQSVPYAEFIIANFFS